MSALTLAQRVNFAVKAAVGIFSDDSIQAAYGLLSGVLPGGAGTPPTRGTADYLRAYSQMPWLRAVAARVSTATAKADWQLFAVGKPGQKARQVKAIQRAPIEMRHRLLKQAAAEQELRRVTEHPLLDALHSANEFHTGLSMRKVTQLHLDLVGDCFWLKERDAQGTPVAFWPVPPHWILATPTPRFRFFRVSFRGWRGNIPDTEFVWFSDIDPLNPYGRGTGTAMALGDELDTDEYAARFTKNFFFNSARPDLLIWPKNQQGMSPGNVKRMEEDWLAQTQGFFRAFKPYFMSREVEVKELEHNFRALTFVQLREFERNAIMQMFGIPPEILGVLADSNRATIDAADYFMGKYVVEPRLEFQRTVMQERLVPEYDERLILDYVSPIQEDKELHLKAAVAMPGSLTVNEWRAMQGHGPLKDEEAGALHLIPSTIRPGPMEEPEPPPALAPFAGRPPGEEPEPGAKPLPGEEQPGPQRSLAKDAGDDWKSVVAEDIAAALDAQDKSLADDLRAMLLMGEELPAATAAAAKMEPALQRALVRVRRDHAARVSLPMLELSIAEGDALAIEVGLDPDGLCAAQGAAVRAHAVRAVMRGAELGAWAMRRNGVAVRGLEGEVDKKRGPVAVDLQAVNPAAVRWAEERAARLVQAGADQREIIRLLVAEAIELGIPPRELARVLRDVVGLTRQQAVAVRNFERRLREREVADEVVARRVARYAEAQHRYRALNIARTELNAALNRGQQLLWDQAVRQGVIEARAFKKEWIVAADDRLCPYCEAMEGEQVAVDEHFSGGVDQPPLHPSCRCATGLVAVRKTAEAPVPVIEVHALPAPAQARRSRRLEYDSDGRIVRVVEEE